MRDRSELALQLTDAVAAARAAVERAGDRAFRAYGLSHRAHAALNAVDESGPDGRARAANELTITRWDPVSKQPIFKTAAVRVERLAAGDGDARVPTVATQEPAA